MDHLVCKPMNQSPLHFEMKKVFPQCWKPERLTYQKKKMKTENQDSEREKSASNQIIKEN